MEYYQKNRHHIGIIDPSTGDALGFVCSQENNVPIYSELDGQRLVDLFTTNPTQVSTDPMKELILGAETHHAGFGQEYYDPKDPYKYFQSYGMDLSVKGQAMAGWNSSTCTKPSGTAAGYTNPTGFTDADAAWTDEAKAYDDNAATYAYEDILANSWGKLLGFTIGAEFYCDKVRFDAYYLVNYIDSIKIEVQKDLVWTTIYTGAYVDHTSTEKSFTGAIITGARVSFYNSEGSTRQAKLYEFDFYRAATPIGTTVAHATFNGKEYASFGKVLAVMTTGTTFTYLKMFNYAITDLVPYQVSGTDYLLVFFGTSAPYQYMVAAQTFTVSTATYKTFQFGAWVNTTVDTMYANSGNNAIRSTVNPLNAGTEWSNPPTYVGEASIPITSLRNKDGALLIDKQDRPYYLDSSGNVQKSLAPECDSGKATHSGKNSTIWQGVYYRPTGDQALLASGKYADGTLGKNEWVQPAKYTTGNSEFVGQVEAVAGDEEYLYLASDNDTKAMIFKGRPEVIDGVTQQVWHPFHELTITGVETMWISNVVAKRLYISSSTASESLFYLPLPTKYGDIVNDSAATFKTDTYFITAGQHGGFKSDLKQLIKVEATLGHDYDANVYFESWYKILGGSWVDLGDMKGTTANRTATLYRSTATTSQVFFFKFVVKTNSTSKTPILLNWKAKTLLFAEDKKIIYTKVRVGRGVTGKNGDSFSDKYELQKTCMDNMRAATNHITMTNLDGTTKYVRMLTLPESPQWAWRKPIRSEKGDIIEWEYSLLLLEVKLS